MSDQFGSPEYNEGGAIQPPSDGGWTPAAPAPPAPPVPPSPYDQPAWGQQPYGQTPPQPGYGQQPGAAYGQPMYQQYGYAPGVGTALNPYESRGTSIMVFGILGLVACQIMGPVAWVMGRNLKTEAEAAGWPEPGNAKAGRICGIIATCLLGLSLVMVVIWLVFFGIIAGSSAVN